MIHFLLSVRQPTVMCLAFYMAHLVCLFLSFFSSGDSLIEVVIDIILITNILQQVSVLRKIINQIKLNLLLQISKYIKLLVKTSSWICLSQILFLYPLTHLSMTVRQTVALSIDFIAIISCTNIHGCQRMNHADRFLSILCENLTNELFSCSISFSCSLA